MQVTLIGGQNPSGLIASKVATLFSNMLDGFVYAKILTDAVGKPVDYVYLDVNDAYERIFSVKKETILG